MENVNETKTRQQIRQHIRIFEKRLKRMGIRTDLVFGVLTLPILNGEDEIANKIETLLENGLEMDDEAVIQNLEEIRDLIFGLPQKK